MTATSDGTFAPLGVDATVGVRACHATLPTVVNRQCIRVPLRCAGLPCLTNLRLAHTAPTKQVQTSLEIRLEETRPKQQNVQSSTQLTHDKRQRRPRPARNHTICQPTPSTAAS